MSSFKTGSGWQMKRSVIKILRRSAIFSRMYTSCVTHSTSLDKLTDLIAFNSGLLQLHPPAQSLVRYIVGVVWLIKHIAHMVQEVVGL